MARQVVFIASAPHSGSTLLEHLLAGDERVVALGEVYQLVNPRSRLRQGIAGERCGCGESIAECPFWRPALAALGSAETADAVARYGTVLSSVHELFGGGRVIVDSSKTPAALQALVAAPDVELRVVHLVRDVRGWLVSLRASFARNPPRHRLHTGWRRWALQALKPLRESRLYGILWWYRENRRIARILESAPVASIRISYEALCADTARTIERLSAFTGLAVRDRPAVDPKRLHNVFGNRMRFDPEKRRRIEYDDRWRRDPSWRAPARLVPFVMAYSRELNREAPASWKQES